MPQTRSPSAHCDRRKRRRFRQTLDVALTANHAMHQITIAPLKTIAIVLALFGTSTLMFISLTYAAPIDTLIVRGGMGLVFGLLAMYFSFLLITKKPLIIVGADGIHSLKIDSRLMGRTFVPWKVISAASVKTVFLPYFVAVRFMTLTLDQSMMDKSVPMWLHNRKSMKMNISMLKLNPDDVLEIVKSHICE